MSPFDLLQWKVMHPSVEFILVLLIVGAAVFALGRRLYVFIVDAGQRGSACGNSCGGCASKADDVKSALKPLIQLDLNSERDGSAAR